MTDRDFRLIAKARELSWEQITFEDQADTVEAMNIIHRIKMTKYRADEHKAGLD